MGKPSSDAFLPVYTQLMKIFGQIQGAVVSTWILADYNNVHFALQQYPVDGQICSEEVVVELE